MVKPELMCGKHLAAEHLEIHMFVNAIRAGRKLDGYATGSDGIPKLEISSLIGRHDDLAEEMLVRGYRHLTPLTTPIVAPISKYDHIWDVRIDPEVSKRILGDRCQNCARIQGST